jgi:N-acetylglucosaminyldiphosphoundecaprenol N-acetyl-beta-D-mannosaminyltransferase
MRRLGLEWLYRLGAQPWRWRRMMRLPLFVLLVVKEYLQQKVRAP